MNSGWINHATNESVVLESSVSGVPSAKGTAMALFSFQPRQQMQLFRLLLLAISSHSVNAQAVLAAGLVTTFAGGRGSTIRGSADGVGTSATFFNTAGIAVFGTATVAIVVRLVIVMRGRCGVMRGIAIQAVRRAPIIGSLLPGVNSRKRIRILKQQRHWQLQHRQQHWHASRSAEAYCKMGTAVASLLQLLPLLPCAD